MHVKRLLVLVLVILTLAGLASTGLTAALLWPVQEPALHTPADYGLHYETLTFTPPTGAVLKGWFLSNPAAHGRTVVLLHGISANKSIVLGRGVDIEKLGYNVLLVDLRRFGESTGSMTTYGFDESREIGWVADRLVERPDVSKDGVIVVGCSLGGAVALQTLPYPHVRAVVADSAFADLASMMAWRGHQWHVPSWPFQDLCTWEVSMVAPFRVDEISPVSCLSHSRKPVFLIHGSGDTSVPFQQALELSRAGDPNTTFWAVPGAEHLQAFRLHHDEYMRRLSTFLAKAY